MHSQDSAGGFGPPGRGFESLRALFNSLTFLDEHSLEFKKVRITTSVMYSSFKIGLALLSIASIWIVIVFSGGEKISYTTDLESKETTSLELDLNKNGIGFYILTIPNYSKNIIFVQISDSNGNVIADKKIATKMAVNYFKFSHSGRYNMEITNISEGSVKIQADFGDTKAGELLIPLFISFSGAGFVIFSGYKKLSSQSTAQPEENTS